MSRIGMSRIPLAWLSLVHDRRRFFFAAGGVTFAVVLMFLELGFLFAINDSNTLLIDAFDADLLIVSRLKNDTNVSKPFARRRLSQARSVDGVTDVYPVYLSRRGVWRSHGQKRQDSIRTIAFDPRDPVFRLPAVDAQRKLLQRDDTALVDLRLRDSYGGLTPGTRGELQGRRLTMVGGFELGPDLQLNATLLMSDRTFRGCFTRGKGGPADLLSRVDFGLVQAQPGADLDALAARLRNRLPDDVRVWTPSQMKSIVHWHWTRNKPVGAVFGLGLAVGFVIGVIICYQILFTDVHDHLPQFATLKAIGYDNRYLIQLAIRRGTYLALAAMALGLPLSLFGYGILQQLTSLVFRLTVLRFSVVLLATIVMCALASVLAMRKALATDPAEVYR